MLNRDYGAFNLLNEFVLRLLSKILLWQLSRKRSIRKSKKWCDLELLSCRCVELLLYCTGTTLHCTMARRAPHHQYGPGSHWLRRQTARNRRLPLSWRFFADQSIRNSLFSHKKCLFGNFKIISKRYVARVKMKWIRKLISN